MLALKNEKFKPSSSIEAIGLHESREKKNKKKDLAQVEMQTELSCTESNREMGEGRMLPRLENRCRLPEHLYANNWEQNSATKRLSSRLPVLLVCPIVLSRLPSLGTMIAPAGAPTNP